MRRRSILLTGAVTFLGAAGFAGSRMVEPRARPALGFVAKVVCSNVFVGGATREQALADLPDEPVARLVRTRVDPATRRVTASIPLIARRSASYRQGLGCTLEPFAAATLPYIEVAPRQDSTMAWPHGDHVDMHGITGIDTERLDAAIEAAFAEPDPDRPRTTRAVVVVHGGRIAAERYADGYHAGHRFAGWSMTKSVTNALVGILTLQGTLDVRADRLRPAWRTPGDPRHAITLHDLLQMSSGLHFDESYTPSGGATRMLFDAHDAAAVAAAGTIAHVPGTHWSYSSGTTNIITALIRDAFGSDAEYHQFPRRALFDPVGMNSAVIEPDPSGTFVGSSFMYATARDWARFGLLFLRDGVWNGHRVLPPGWVDYSVTPAAAAPMGQYGAHWWLNAGASADTTRRTWPDLPRGIYFASGFQGQYVVIVPSHDLVVVRLGVTEDDRAWSLGDFLAEVITAVDAADDAVRPGICPVPRC